MQPRICFRLLLVLTFTVLIPEGRAQDIPWVLPWNDTTPGVTDFSAQIRWDLTERISVHGGYRVLLLHYKLDASPAPPGTDQ